jgi:nitrogen regulatory protein PII
MHFKLLVALVCDEKTSKVIEAAREAGAMGATIVSNARGEGVKQTRTFFGLNLETQRDLVLFLVEEHLCRKVLEIIAEAGEMETSSGAGIAFQIDVEDAVGVSHQVRLLAERVEDSL